MKHIVSFSGGKDSTAMLLMMIEKKMQIDEIIFCDTGKEFPQMYDHIRKVEKYIGRNITIIRSEKSFEYYLGHHIKTKGANIGEKGFGWPGHIFRWCTGQLKDNPTKKYLKKNKDYSLYLGIAYDELYRKERKHNKNSKFSFPLIDLEITEKIALEYCYSKGFNWSGLYKKFSRVSCYCCPLQPLRELFVLWRDFPELWENIKEMDKMSYRQFRGDYSIADLERKFAIQQQQMLCEFAI